MRRLGTALAIAVSVGAGAGAASALDLTMPIGARLTVERATPIDSFDAPIGTFSGGAVPVRVLEGAVTRRAWRVGTAGLTVLQVMAPLRAQLEALGYSLAFECVAASCGGFDFRFDVEVLPGPNMYVNIGTYRYLTAFKGPPENPTEALTVLASVTSDSAYIQIIEAVTGQVDAVISPPERTTDDVSRPQSGPVAQTLGLVENGFVILRDLDFRSGTSELGAGPFGSLDVLAKVLADDPELRIALVGHTDAVGGLAPNVALSRQRARAVRAHLIGNYDIDPGRLDAEGMGYLSPVASNRTPAGRAENRRVEAIVLNTE